MKFPHRLLLLVAAVLLDSKLTTASAEPHDAKTSHPSEESPAPPKAPLSSRDVLRRIAEQTGGLYRFKANPSSEDYRKFLNDALEKPVNK